MHGSIALMAMHMPGIFSSIFALLLCPDSKFAVNNYDLGVYSILMLYCYIPNRIDWSLCDRLVTSFLKIANQWFWSVIMPPS